MGGYGHGYGYGHWLGKLAGASTLALSLFFAAATTTSGTVTAGGVDLTFSRTSSATYWDADGVLQTASAGIARVGEDNRKPVTNLLTYPEQFDNAVWAKSNTSVSGGQSDPFGGTNAFKLIEADTADGSSHQIYGDYANARVGKVYTASIFVAAEERNFLKIEFAGGAALANQFCNYNASSGDVGTVGSNAIDHGMAEVTGTPYYRAWISVLANANGLLRARFYLGEADNDVAYNGDGSSGLYIFGAMFNEGGIEDYIGGTTGDAWYTAGEPTTGFVKAGYTSEAAATNLMTDSEDFSAGSYTIANMDSLTVTTNQAVAPDGTTTMDRLEITDTTSEDHSIVDQVSITAGSTYCFSCAFKPDEQRYVALRVIGAEERFYVAVFDLLAGTVTATDVGTLGTSTLANYGMVRLKDGSYLCFVAGSYSTSAIVFPAIDFVSSATPTLNTFGREAYAGTAGDGLYAWGAQFELGTYPSSYIKTSGGTATRAADDDNLIDALFGVEAGTLVYEGTPINSASAATDRVSLNDGTANEVVKFVDDASGNIDFDVTDGGASQASIDTGVNAIVGVRRRVAGAFAAGDFAASANGLAAVTDASGTVPTLTRMDLGRGHHKEVLFYTERKSDADLATLSKITDPGTSWRIEQEAA